MTTAMLNASLIGVVEIPRGVGPTGGKGSSSSRISSPSAPSIVGSTLMATRSTGALGAGTASHSAGSGTGTKRDS